MPSAIHEVPKLSGSSFGRSSTCPTKDRSLRCGWFSRQRAHRSEAPQSEGLKGELFKRATLDSVCEVRVYKQGHLYCLYGSVAVFVAWLDWTGAFSPAPPLLWPPRSVSVADS